MLVLGLDTSTSTGGVAVVDDSHILANYQLALDSSHSMRLFPAIRRVLEDVKLSLAELDAIAIVRGPGSFTGLRIGVMAAKTLAHLGHIQLVGISTLEALAYPLRISDAVICPMMDALRGDIYGAIYNCRMQNAECRFENPQLKDGVFSLARFFDEVGKVTSLLRDGMQCLFVGNGALKYKKEIEERFGNKVIFPSDVFQSVSPAAVAELGLKKLLKGASCIRDPLSFQPTYLRKPEAEVVWEKRMV